MEDSDFLFLEIRSLKHPPPTSSLFPLHLHFPTTTQSIMSSRKRQRTTQRFTVQKRPIDKSLVALNGAAGTSQTSTTLIQATFPCTVTGLRWDLSFTNSSASLGHTFEWAIVVVRDGRDAEAMGTSDGAKFYAPEQDVLTYGNGRLWKSDRVYLGSTKSMRKLMGGDALMFIVRAGSTSVVDYRGTVQLFCKT